MDEYQVKAAFLYNFARFVDWPPQAFATSDEPLMVCVLGEDPFGRALDDVLSGKRIEGRALSVRRISDARRTKGCHIVFISSLDRKQALAVLAAMNEPGLLTIGESGNAASGDTIISFVLEEGKVRFAIDSAAAERAKLRVSSRLLSLALQVRK